MRILLVTQIFLPEMGAQANRLYPFVRQFVAAGHKVFVATGMPNYPHGNIFPDYAGKYFFREDIEGANVLRTIYFTAPRNKSKLTQMLSYLSFIPAAFYSGLRAGKVDIVLVTSPPIFSVIPAIVLAKLRGAKLVLDIRDLWPDEIVACGAARQDSLPIKAMGVIERWGYGASSLLSCTTRSFIETVVGRGVSPGKAMLIPNGADLELFRPLTPDNALVREYPFGNRFVVMYSGLLGIKHGLEVILEAAQLLRGEKNIVFFLLGRGAREAALACRAQEMGLDNIIFGGERGVKDIPHLLARADVCLSALLPDAYLEKIITVKVFEYLACQKPVVASLAGETARVLQDSGGGMVVPPGDPRALAEAILSLYRDPARCALMGQRGRRYVEENYSRSMWARRLEGALNSLDSNDRRERAGAYSPASSPLE